MFRYNALGILIITALILSSCEVPVDIPFQKAPKEYVVDGMIADSTGQYLVSLTYSAAYTIKSAGSHFPVEGAQVSIIDTSSEDSPEILIFYGGGKYYTSNTFRGKTNHVYILHILTPDGDELMSYPEKLPPPADVLSSHHEFVKKSSFHPEGDRVWLTIQDTPGKKNFYRWTYEGIYQFSSVINYAPYPDTCWMREYFYFDLDVASDRYFDGQVFNKDITVVPHFSKDPYLIYIYTQSLTERAYDFWEQVDRQVNHSNGIFGSPAAHIQGNMYCVNNPDREVFGYFRASSVVKTCEFIRRDNEGIVLNYRIYEPIPCNEYRYAEIYTGKLEDDPECWERFNAKP